MPCGALLIFIQPNLKQASKAAETDTTSPYFKNFIKKIGDDQAIYGKLPINLTIKETKLSVSNEFRICIYILTGLEKLDTYTYK